MPIDASVATAWLESRKPDKPSRIEAEPSCRNSFGFAMAWLWPKMVLSGCKRLKRDFVPDLAEVCLSPFILSLDHLIALPCLLGTRYVTQILSELGTLVYGTRRHPPGVCRSREGRRPLDRTLSQSRPLDRAPLLVRHSVCNSNTIRGCYTSLRHPKAPPNRSREGRRPHDRT